MDQTTLKIACAGLAHDIGKLAQDCMQLTKEYVNRNAGQYQPFSNNHYTHRHSLYTAAFIEHYADLLPRLLNSGDWGEGDSFLNLAAGHHNPETVLQQIITQADRLSAGADRASFEDGKDIAVREFRKTRLLPLFEALNPDSERGLRKRDDYQWEYPLKPLAPETIFPSRRNQQESDKESRERYQDLFDVLVKGLGELEDKDTDLELWYTQFDSLLKWIMANVPAARAGAVVHDISLYDHMRTTAAFAAAMYLYHKENNSLEDAAVRERESQKFLLITGDFYGIQDFIFASGGVHQKFRSKILRGRSFQVSLFAEMAADMVCRRIGLPHTSVVLEAAGKFTILAPNTETARVTVKSVEKEINDWLFSLAYGQSTIGFAVTPCAPKDFEHGNFSALYDSHLENVAARKACRIDLDTYGGPVEGYLETFQDENVHLCSFCGQRSSDPGLEKDPVLARNQQPCCRVCRDQVYLGSKIVKNTRFEIFHRDDAPGGKKLQVPIFGTYQLSFQEHNGGRGEEGHPLKKYVFEGWTEKGHPPVAVRLLNGHVPVFTDEDLRSEKLFQTRHGDDKLEELLEQIEPGQPKTFTHIAIEAKKSGGETKTGTEALGVLKADVDNLGLIMGCGLPDALFSISRMATLSRQLDAFFTLYLPSLLRNSSEYRNTYTVFAGGDDLFLIGPWNVMVKLARELRRQFATYVCENPKLTFSAGISFHKTNVPVEKLATSAETGLEQAKGISTKDSVTIFGQTVAWAELDELLQNGKTMQGWLDRNLLSSSMFYKFNTLLHLAGRAKKAESMPQVPLEELDALKWRSTFSYLVHRNISSSLKGSAREEAAKEISQMAMWMNRFGEKLRIPLWHILYEKR